MQHHKMFDRINHQKQICFWEKINKRESAHFEAVMLMKNVSIKGQKCSKRIYNRQICQTHTQKWNRNCTVIGENRQLRQMSLKAIAR